MGAVLPWTWEILKSPAATDPAGSNHTALLLHSWMHDYPVAWTFTWHNLSPRLRLFRLARPFVICTQLELFWVKGAVWQITPTERNEMKVSLNSLDYWTFILLELKTFMFFLLGLNWQTNTEVCITLKLKGEAFLFLSPVVLIPQKIFKLPSQVILS